jgi:hypothetical protein
MSSEICNFAPYPEDALNQICNRMCVRVYVCTLINYTTKK